MINSIIFNDNIPIFTEVVTKLSKNTVIDYKFLSLANPYYFHIISNGYFFNKDITFHISKNNKHYNYDHFYLNDYKITNIEWSFENKYGYLYNNHSLFKNSTTLMSDYLSHTIYT